MNFYGVDMKGPLHLQICDVLPTWTPEDERRLVYLSTDDSIYLGTGTGWIRCCGGGGGGSCCEDVMIRKFVSNVDVTQTGVTTVYTVPTGQMYLPNTFELITTQIAGPATMPFVTWGVQLDMDVFVTHEQIDSTMNATYNRQIWEKPHGGCLSGTEIKLTVTIAGTSTTHIVTAVTTGYLIPMANNGPNVPYPAHNILFEAQEFSW